MQSHGTSRRQSILSDNAESSFISPNNMALEARIKRHGIYFSGKPIQCAFNTLRKTPFEALPENLRAVMLGNIL